MFQYLYAALLDARPMAPAWSTCGGVPGRPSSCGWPVVTAEKRSTAGMRSMPAERRPRGDDPLPARQQHHHRDGRAVPRAPTIDFGTINHELTVPLDFSLEHWESAAFSDSSRSSSRRDLVGEVRRGGTAAVPASYDDRHPYGSLSELYAEHPGRACTASRTCSWWRRAEAAESTTSSCGSRSTRHHPDYQLEVDDLSSALFAIDVVTEQGEGNVLTPATAEEASHFDTFLRISDLLRSDRQMAGPRGRRAPWTPAYPVVRNPTLGQGNAAMETRHRSGRPPGHGAVQPVLLHDAPAHGPALRRAPGREPAAVAT